MRPAAPEFEPRAQDALEAVEAPLPFVWRRLLDAPGFGFLRQVYLDALTGRLRSELGAFQCSELLASVRAEHGAEVVSNIRTICATESLDAVSRHLQTRLSNGMPFGMALLVGAFMAVWQPADRGVTALVLGCLAGVTVYLLHILALKIALDGRRRDGPRATTLATLLGCALSVAAVVFILVESGLTALGAVTAILAALLALMFFGLEFSEPDARGDARINILFVVVVAGAGGVLPGAWDVDTGWSTVGSLIVPVLGAPAVALGGVIVLDEISARHLRSAAALTVLLGGIAAALLWLSGRLPDGLAVGVSSALAGGGAGVLGAAACQAATNAAGAYLYRWKAATWPQADVVESLVEVALVIESGNRWNPEIGAGRAVPMAAEVEADTLTDIAAEFAEARATARGRFDETRERVASLLNWVVGLLRRDLPRPLTRGTNEGVEVRVREQTELMAQAVEDWLFEVAMHGPTGLDELAASVRQALPCAVRGDWDEFPQNATKRSERTLSRLRTAISVLRTLAAAAVPVALVAAVTQITKLPDAAVASLYTFAVTFFAVTALRLLDPKSGSDLQTTQGLVDKVTGVATRAITSR